MNSLEKILSKYLPKQPEPPKDEVPNGQFC